MMIKRWRNWRFGIILSRILSGEKALPMEVVSSRMPHEAIDKQNQVQDSLLDCLAGNRIVKVKLESDGGD